MLRTHLNIVEAHLVRTLVGTTPSQNPYLECYTSAKLLCTYFDIHLDLYISTNFNRSGNNHSQSSSVK